jgi:hypothetical protein
MKKTIAVLSLLISTVSFGQLPSITAANQIPVVFDTIFYSDASSFGFDEAGSGGVIDVLWDYSTLSPTGALNFSYGPVAGTPEAANYPAATIAMANSLVAGYEYFENTASTISRSGYSGAQSIYYAPSFMRYSFPLTPGVPQSALYTGTMSALGVGEDSVTISMGNYQMMPDAWGTVILPESVFGGPDEVFDSVVRVHVTESFTINAWIAGAPLVLANITDDYYFWFDEETQEPILIYGTTDDGSGGVTTVLRYQSEILGTGTGAVAPTIATTNDVTPTTWCVTVPTIVTVNFVATGTMNAGNVYTAEISDAAGSFAAPVSIGTLNSAASGNLTVNAIAPGSLAAGTGYRIRVTASDPATTGLDNTTDLVIDPCTGSINEIDGELILLYPNPTQTSFTLETETPVDEVVLVDMNGRVVKTFTGQSVYDIADLNEGMYLVHITQNGTQQVKRLTVR